MAAIVVVPTPHKKPVKFGNYATDMTFVCSAAIAAGQAVGLNTSGQLIVPASGGAAIGAALYGGEAGDEIAVRVSGVVAMYNGDGSVAIAAGVAVQAGALGGVILKAAGAQVGIALEPIAGGAFGYVKLSQVGA